METPADSALSRIERAHQMYREGKHEQALALYSEALILADSKSQKIALHSNRAACYLKMHDFKKAAEECTAVLDLDRQHTGALMLRAQTFVTMKDYQSALFDVNRLMEINPNSEVYLNLQARLKTQLSLAPIPESEEEIEEETLNLEKGDEKQKAITTKVVKMTVLPPKPPKPNNPSTTTDKVNPTKTKDNWETIPKPKGHSNLDYSRWDKVEDSSSDEESDEQEEEQPNYRFRVRKIGIRSVN